MSNENRKMVNLNDRQGRLLAQSKSHVAKTLKDECGWTGIINEGEVCEFAMEVLLGKKHYKGSKHIRTGQ